MNTFLPSSAPSAPLLAQPSAMNTRDPMQQLAALMTPQQSYGAGGAPGMQLGLADLMRMLQKPQGQTGAPSIPGSGQPGASPGPGTGGQY